MNDGGFFRHNKAIFFLLFSISGCFLFLCCKILREETGVFYSAFVQHFAQALSAAIIRIHSKTSRIYNRSCGFLVLW